MAVIVLTQYPPTDLEICKPILYQITNEQIPANHTLDINTVLPYKGIKMAWFWMEVENLDAVNDYILKMAHMLSTPECYETLHPLEKHTCTFPVVIPPDGIIQIEGTPNQNINLTLRFIYGFA